VQLELLDGRGDPLNPPFNSVVREVVVGTGNRPAWLRPNLTPAELALLAGEQLAPAPEAPLPPISPEPQALAPSDEAAPAEEPAPEPIAAAEPPADQPAPHEPDAEQPADKDEADTQAVEDSEEPPLIEGAANEPPQPEEPALASAPPERVAPQSSLSGSARDQVNADGTLQQPPARGPLAGLREKLGG